jgi:hypothetical protein
MNKEEFVRILVAEHTKIVMAALGNFSGRSATCIPESVLSYTQRYMSLIKDIIKEMK